VSQQRLRRGPQQPAAAGTSVAAETGAEVSAAPKGKFTVAKEDTEEFEVSAAPEWNPDADPQPGPKK